VTRFVDALRRSLRGKDVSLHAAAVTFYGGIAVVPAALLAIRFAALLAGGDWVRHVTAPVVGATPSRLGADRALAVLLDAGLRMTPWQSVAALIPATLYGEGLRRAFVSLTGADRSALVGWRGRVLILPVLAAGPVLLVGLLSVLPRAAHLLGRGGWSTVWSVVISFLAVWLALSPVLIIVYRLVGPLRPSWLTTALCGSFTAANLSGFAHGFILFWSLPLNLGVPFGGLNQVGAVVAVALWLYLFHLLALVGYAVTLVLDAERRPNASSTRPPPLISARTTTS
jgi:membrane protein